MSIKENTFKICTNTPHKWPESIDIDKKGNLYFTDTSEGTLYKIKRNDDKTLEPETALIRELKGAGGISIDREKNVLYLGAVIESNEGDMSKIFRIPLRIFESDAELPLTYKELNKYASDKNTELSEWDISNNPNGVVLDKRGNAIYYTFERLRFFSPVIKLKGHIGKIHPDTHEKPLIIKELYSPNGIDIDASSEETNMIVAITLENSIKRFTLSNGKITETVTVDLGKGGHWLLKHLPDGLLRMDNGDILVAAFGSGKILYIPWNAGSYGDPVEVVNGLGHPTDLIIGPSSSGNGESLFVTTKSSWISRDECIAKGKVIEIDIIALTLPPY